MSYGRRRRVTLALQALYLVRLGLPAARTVLPGGNRLTYHFQVAPFAGARTYQCLITLDRLGVSPRAFVQSPNLVALACGKPLPHIYPNDGSSTRLCLYLPSANEWSSELLLSETFVPWTVEWLRFFELWLVDGEWRGGGIHPVDGSPAPAA